MTLRDTVEGLQTFIVRAGFCAAGLLVACTAAAGTAKIGYGSSDAVLPAKDQELFYTGFELGWQLIGPSRKVADWILRDQVSDGSPLGAAAAADRLERQGVVALVGFPTSHEALLAAGIAAQKKVLGIFIGASHTKLAEMGPYVFTTGPSSRVLAQGLVDFANQKFPAKKGLLVSNPEAAFSKNLETSITAISPTPQGARLDPAHLNQELILTPDVIARLKKGEYQFICITSYASESRKLMEQLQGAGVDLPILSSATWATGDFEFIRRFIAERKSPIYAQRDWIRGSKDSLPFERALAKKRRQPLLEIAYGFDLGAIVGETLDRVKGPLTRESFASAFWSNPCFDRLSSGPVCFDPKGGHANRPLKNVMLTNDGFRIAH